MDNDFCSEGSKIRTHGRASTGGMNRGPDIYTRSPKCGEEKVFDDIIETASEKYGNITISIPEFVTQRSK